MKENESVGTKVCGMWNGTMKLKTRVTMRGDNLIIDQVEDGREFNLVLLENEEAKELYKFLKDVFEDV